MEMGLCPTAPPTACGERDGFPREQASSWASAPYVVIFPYGIFLRSSHTANWNRVPSGAIGSSRPSGCRPAKYRSSHIFPARNAGQSLSDGESCCAHFPPKYFCPSSHSPETAAPSLLANVRVPTGEAYVVVQYVQNTSIPIFFLLSRRIFSFL